MRFVRGWNRLASPPMMLSRRALLLAAAAGAPRALAAQPFTILCPLTVEPAVLIPGVSDAFVTRFLGGKIYRGLMRYAPDGSLQPDLASAAGVSADRLTYLFRLRPGVTWHDSGGLDAGDVVFSLARFHAALQPALRLERVRVEAADPLTVVLHLSAPDDFSMRLLDALSLPIVPQHVHDVAGWGLDPRIVTPVGSGPFRMERWLRLVRFEWFIGPMPALAAIECPVLPDPAARLALAGGDPPLLLAGDAASSALAPRMRAAGLAVEADYPPAARSMAGLRLNTAVKPLDKPEVRQALACAIDRDLVVKEAWSGLARVATGPLLAGSAGRNEAAALPAYSPRAAAERLNAAGLRPDESGMRARLRYLHPLEAPWDALFGVLRRALLQVGVELTAEPVPPAAWRRRVADGEYETTGFEAPQTGEARIDLAPYAAMLPGLQTVLADGRFDDAQTVLAAGMPVLWLVELGEPLARDKRLSVPGGVLSDFTATRLAS